MSVESLTFLASAFDASGTYFASAVTALDLNKILVSPASSAQSTNALHIDYTLPKGVTVQTLTWVYATIGKGGINKLQKKKRKRSLTATANGNGLANAAESDIENALIAVGTNKGDILLFSPAQNAVIFTLSGVHAVPVTSLASDSTTTSKLWSCDNSGRVAEWDLQAQKTVRSFMFAEPDITFLYSVTSPTNGLLLASNTIYLVDSNNPNTVLKRFPSFLHSTSSILSSANPDIFFAASHGERNIGILSFSKNKTVGLLVAKSDIKQLVVNANSSAVCAVTEDGFVEIFTNPLSVLDNQETSGSTPSKLKSRKAMAVSSFTSTSSIKVFRPSAQAKKPLVKIQNAWFLEDHLVITWIEHGSVPVFEHVKWRDEAGQAITAPIELVKAVKTVAGAQQGTADSAAASRFLEAHTLVKSGTDFSKLDDNTTKEDSDNDEDEDEDDEEGGTLADRLDALEVSDAKKEKVSATALGNKRTNKTPDSFAIILAQALKTNDHALLETCLSTRNEDFVSTSVKRLHSSLAVVLLERIAEKIARAPGRTSSLTLWIKWVIITHGGYLVSLPNLAKSLAFLHTTLANKISMLPRLLALNGRVEMLRGQMQVRREILAANSSSAKETQAAEDEDDDSEVDSEVEYIEDAHLMVNGEEDFDDFEEDEDMADAGNDNSGFIELEAEDSSDVESEEEEEYAGMSDVEAEGVEAADFDNSDDDSSEQEAVQKRKASAYKKANGKSRR